MSEGKVKYFNDLKGWGFLTSESKTEDVYVHHKDIKMKGFRTLKEGQRVLFDLINTDNGLRAQNVTLSE